VKDEPLVRTERRDRVGILTLNRPEARNAINHAITVAIADAIEAFEADDNVWVLVITGAGDQSLSRRAEPGGKRKGRPGIWAASPLSRVAGSSSRLSPRSTGRPWEVAPRSVCPVISSLPTSTLSSVSPRSVAVCAPARWDSNGCPDASRRPSPWN